MKAVLGTVIYKQAEVFLKDLLTSVDNQQDKDFDLLITNDNYTDEDLIRLNVINDQQDANQNLVQLNGKVNFLNLRPLGCTIAQTRIEMIKKAKALGYDLLVVCDADDTFVPTRIGAFKEAYQLDKSYAFYYNGLVTEDGKTVLENMPKTVDSARLISQSNFIGMGTTAINLNMLTDDFMATLSEGDCPVFDWYFFTRLLMDIGPGKLVENADTIYRIHDNNQVGTTHNVEQEYQVKLTHYKNLAKRYPYFEHLYQDLQKLDIDSIDTSHDRNGYWWSNILMEDSYEI